jgi:type I restriction enzyme, S subunit
MVDLAERTLADEVPASYRITELGVLPEGWHVARLGDVCVRPDYGLTTSATSVPTGPKLLRITDIQDNQVVARVA